MDREVLGELAGRIKILSEMSDLPFEAIENFYKKEEDNATEIVQDYAG